MAKTRVPIKHKLQEKNFLGRRKPAKKKSSRKSPKKISHSGEVIEAYRAVVEKQFTTLYDIYVDLCWQAAPPSKEKLESKEDTQPDLFSWANRQTADKKRLMCRDRAEVLLGVIGELREKMTWIKPGVYRDIFGDMAELRKILAP